MHKQEKVTILGIGNTLYSDEGVGVHVLPYLEEVFKEKENIEIVEGATDGMRLLETIEETNHLIIIDAMNGGQQPGTIMKVEGEDIPAYFGIKMSIHQLGFQEVLFASKLRDKLPEYMIMYGVQPQSLEFSLDLSEEVKCAMPHLVEKIQQQVEQWSYEQTTVS